MRFERAAGVVAVLMVCAGDVRAQCPDGSPGPPCKPPPSPVFLGRARVKVLSVEPPVGTVIRAESLAAGVRVKVILEHIVERRPRRVAPYLVLMARGSVRPGETWVPIAERVASGETMQLALDARVTAEHEHDGVVLLRTVVWFKDSTSKKIWAQPGAATMIEYKVERPRH